MSVAYKFQDSGTDKREVLSKDYKTTVDASVTPADDTTPNGATAMNCLAAIALGAAALF